MESLMSDASVKEEHREIDIDAEIEKYSGEASQEAAEGEPEAEEAIGGSGIRMDEDKIYDNIGG